MRSMAVSLTIGMGVLPLEILETTSNVGIAPLVSFSFLRGPERPGLVCHPPHRRTMANEKQAQESYVLQIASLKSRICAARVVTFLAPKHPSPGSPQLASSRKHSSTQ